LPDLLQGGLENASQLDPLIESLRLQHFFDADGVAIGPIPKGTPVALLASSGSQNYC
jgi:hypothetical protein